MSTFISVPPFVLRDRLGRTNNGQASPPISFYRETNHLSCLSALTTFIISGQLNYIGWIILFKTKYSMTKMKNSSFKKNLFCNLKWMVKSFSQRDKYIVFSFGMAQDYTFYLFLCTLSISKFHYFMHQVP